MRTILTALLCAVPAVALAAGTPRAPVTKGGKKPVQAGEAAPQEGPQEDPVSNLDPEELMAAARSAAEAGDVGALSKSLRSLRISSTLNERMDSLVRAGIEHLESGALARAEKTFARAVEMDGEAKLAEVGQEGARTARLAAEKEALADLETAPDPRPAAKVLVAGYEADPNSPHAKQGFVVLKERLQSNVTEAPAAQFAHGIEALAILENTEGDMGQRIAKASVILAEGRAAEAQAAYQDARVGVLGNGRSEVAGWAAEWVRQRRVHQLESELTKVAESGDVVEEDRVVQALLQLDPKHKEANRQAKTLRGRVVQARLEAAAAHQENKEFGPAFIYLTKGLETAPQDPKLSAELAKVKKELEKRSDLILVVGDVESAEACPNLSGQLRTRTQEATSRREDLGTYVLSPGWTEAFEKGDPRVPAVEGRLTLNIASCKVSYGQGEATVAWAIEVPRAPGEAVGRVSQGEITVEVDRALVPKDERDAKGRGATRQLATRIADQVADRISEERDAVDQWLLILGRTFQARGESAQAADAYARLVIDKPLMVDDEAMEKLGSELSQTYR